MSIDNNRLLLKIDTTIRELNRNVINATIPELTIADIVQVMDLVARTRARYLKELFDLAEVAGSDMPSPEQIRQLSALRETYEELVQGAQALETAIQRGYVDVESS